MEWKDELDRIVSLDGPPRRIISLVPSVTETLFWLGAGDRVIGRTVYCNHPPPVRGLPAVGEVLGPDLDVLRGLRPDLVVASASENRKEDVEALSARGVPVYVTDPRTVEGALDSMERLCRMVAPSGPGTGAVAELRKSARTARRSVSRAQEILFVVWPDPLIAPGRDTFVGDLIRWAGAISVAEALPGRWPEVDRAFLAGRPLDAVVLPTEPYAFTEADVENWEGRSMEFREDARVFRIDGERTNRPGPRLVEGMEDLARKLEGDGG
jgi:ABC-type Fe3+-hydroxamate transport system substrate-binding protein